MVIRVEFPYKLPLIGPVLVILAVNWSKTKKERKKREKKKLFESENSLKSSSCKSDDIELFLTRFADQFLAQSDAEGNISVT